MSTRKKKSADKKKSVRTGKKKSSKTVKKKSNVIDISPIRSRKKSAGDLEMAQRVMYDAWEASSSKRRRELALKALEYSPDCADAYVLLAEEFAESLDEALELFEEGMKAGERALGKKTFKEDAGLFWDLLETRPYMRARAGLAQCLWIVGRQEESVAHYQDMLRLNPNDNQGIRYILMTCLLRLDRDEELAALLEEYREDGSAEWTYTNALAAFRRHGDTGESRAALSRAVESNSHVPKYLLGKKKLPRRLPDYISFGDENEAVTYAAENMACWAGTPGALVWLALPAYR
ncbi:MAG: hypothetical protein ACE5E9_14410 [Nitrospinaceae bacterium]